MLQWNVYVLTLYLRIKNQKENLRTGQSSSVKRLEDGRQEGNVYSRDASRVLLRSTIRIIEETSSKNNTINYEEDLLDAFKNSGKDSLSMD